MSEEIDFDIVEKQQKRIMELEALVKSLENGYRCRMEGYQSLVDELREALIWCGGSADFGPGGKAEAGWNKVCRPLLVDA